MNLIKNPTPEKSRVSIKALLLSLGFSSAVIISATNLTAPSEGLITSPYLDGIGLKTVCYGTTDNNNIGVVIKDKVYTEQECTLMLAQELQEIEHKIAPMIKVQINDYQKAAFLDFSYNLGTVAFQKSSILGLMNAGNTKAACTRLMEYIFAGSCKQGMKDCVQTSSGKWKFKFNGLVKRRELEMKYCLGDIKMQDGKQ